MNLNESTLEDTALEWSGALGYAARRTPQLAPGEPAAEQDSFGEVVLVGPLRNTLVLSCELLSLTAILSRHSEVRLTL